MNTDDPELALLRAEDRVLEIQTKLHRWARDDPHRAFGDLFNLVTDPAFLLVAWDRVRSNKGAKTAGVDGRTALSIVLRVSVEDFLDDLRASLKDRFRRSGFAYRRSRGRLGSGEGGRVQRLAVDAPGGVAGDPWTDAGPAQKRNSPFQP